MTSGELISAVIRYYLNQGGSDSLNAEARRKAEFHLQSLSNKAHSKAPWHWKRTTANITLPADGLGAFDFPTNFHSIGTRGQMFISGQRFELQYLAADVIERNRQNDTGTSSRPEFYGYRDQSALGVKKGRVYRINSGALTLVLANYDKKPPVIVDRPIAPTLTSAVGGAMGAGTWLYRITYETIDGETEGGPTASITLGSATDGYIVSVVVPASNNSKVTTRNVYRSEEGGTDCKLLTTITHNEPITIEDEAADNTLGDSVPTTAEAVTGLELFPSGYHESVFYEGLKARLMNNQGDLREPQADAAFMDGIRDMWINSKEDRNRVPRLARYGQSAYRQ